MIFLKFIVGLVFKETLMANSIDGQRLIYLDASHLPKIGIQDFEHIKVTLIQFSFLELFILKSNFLN